MSYSTEDVPEVAVAFREALEDLQRNDQYEIDNLTVIAKESTEHAQAICQELENHIRKTRPEFKLPALYLLDSLVKHVGTPYTVYLSRNLYRTFFDAFTVVDANTRKAMEELFRSWRQPVPESRDPRPVFPVEVTQPIDAALIKVRGVALKAREQEEQARMKQMRQQLPSRFTPNLQPGRTPTPTGAYPYQPPSIVGQNSNPNSQDIAAMMSGFQRESTPTYPPAVRSPVPASLPSPIRQGVMSLNQGYAPPPQSGTPLTYAYTGPPPATMSHQARLQKLRADVQGLIESAKAHLARNPYDTEKSKLLQNLQSLKVLLDGGQLSLAHIQSTEVVVANIAKDLPPIPPPSAAPQMPQINPSLLASLLSGSTPQPTPPQNYSQPYSQPVLPAVSTPQFAPALPVASAAQPVPAPSVSMAHIMSLLKPSTPAVSGATPVPGAAPPPTNSLLDSLRAAGLLGGAPAHTPVAASNIPQVPRMQTPAQMNNDVKLDSASIKIRRPYLIRKLYEDRPDQCRQCGMRFQATEEGKKAKGIHLDWHFKVNSRVADSMKSAINRSWYIDEREWISYREELDGYTGVIADVSSAGGKAGGKAKEPKEHWVPVPTDLKQANQPCSICQEKFDVEWHKEAEQPVWKDAIKVGNKYYHASCYAEVMKGNAAAAATAMERTASNSARSTPDPVLGKRSFHDFKHDTAS